MFKYFTFFVVILVFIGCRTNPPVSSDMPDLNQIIKEREEELGYNLKDEYNNDNTYVLFEPDRGKQYGMKGDEINNFIIVRLNDSTVVFDEKIRGGIIKWVSLEEVEIFYPSGIPGNEKNVIYNVISGKKSSLLE